MGTHPIFESDFDCLTETTEMAGTFLYCLSWVSFVFQITFAVLSLAAGLYYVAEIIEEFTNATKRIVYFLIVATSAIFIGLLLFESFPLKLIATGLFSNLVYMGLLRAFPMIDLSSPNFILSLIMLTVNHVFAFGYFGEVYHQFHDVLAYFTICVWLVPFTFFISLSAGENTLPTSQYGGSDDALSHYMNRGKKQRGGLLKVLELVREAILPSRAKRY